MVKVTRPTGFSVVNESAKTILPDISDTQDTIPGKTSTEVLPSEPFMTLFAYLGAARWFHHNLRFLERRCQPTRPNLGTAR